MHFRPVLLGLIVYPLLCAPRPAGQGVEILWDRYGVAHVYAKSAEGMFFGYGYAQMQSHGDLVLKLYGESRGRATEYWGGTANLELDEWVHTNGIPERGAAWYQQQTPEFRKCLDAFAAGMNEYARRHPEKLDAARRRVLPVTGADPVLHTHRIMHFTYVSSLARVQSAATGKSVGMAGIGSNAWAISPKKSASGKTMMIMNPHLPWQDWYTYYEIHLNGPGMNLYGASQVGFPVLRFVFSDHLGFTQTVNNIDASDLYRITREGENQYRFDGAARAFTTREATIQVRQPDGTLAPKRLAIRSTVHGPVVWDRDGLTLALRTAGLDRPFGLDQYWRMATARNFREYETQLKRLQVPTFNITYGDREGHVMYFFNGTLPKRSQGDLAFWAGIVPGDTSATLWTDVHPYEDLPKIIDPPAGWVQNTNDPPWTGTYPLAIDPGQFPAYAAGRDYSLRTARSLRMLHEDDRITFDELVAYKHSTRLELADRVLPDLLQAAAGTPAAEVLAKWDRTTDNASRGALLFEAFARRFLGPALTSRANFAVPLDPQKPFDTPRGLKDPAAARRMLEEAAQEVERTFGSLDAPWGDFLRLRRDQVDLPANGASGSLGAFRVLQYGAPQADKKRTAMMGDTFVACVEFSSPPRAMVLTSYGNASQPGSPHRTDQLTLLSEKKLRPAWRSRAEVEANLASRDRF